MDDLFVDLPQSLLHLWPRFLQLLELRELVAPAPRRRGGDAAPEALAGGRAETAAQRGRGRRQRPPGEPPERLPGTADGLETRKPPQGRKAENAEMMDVSDLGRQGDIFGSDHQRLDLKGRSFQSVCS